MIKHIVMWRLAEKAQGLSKMENAGKMKTIILALKDFIPQIVNIDVGINFNPSDAAWDVVLYSEFASVKDLEIYQEHPEHKKVGVFINKVKTDRAVADYEM